MVINVKMGDDINTHHGHDHMVMVELLSAVTGKFRPVKRVGSHACVDEEEHRH